MKSIVAAVLVFVIGFVHAQNVPATGGTMPGAWGTMPGAWGTMAGAGGMTPGAWGNQGMGMAPGMDWSQYFVQSGLFDVDFHRVFQAEQFSRLLGNGPGARFAVGRILDMPENWWIGSAALNNQVPGAFAALAMEN